ncbi:hypothetical protein [Glycomyces paridis]|uniref:Uncharacterized protein n=1 Tax=Glycomyces paridis TaxID=2126555 RepID=A0A4S8NZ06_9ACTN|nr:hypothetical protein [Glycomyces paridis]THV22095.1 hypothetical protein E9998_24055 [Glycomyces paridis]
MEKIALLAIGGLVLVSVVALALMSSGMRERKMSARRSRAEVAWTVVGALAGVGSLAAALWHW